MADGWNELQLFSRRKRSLRRLQLPSPAKKLLRRQPVPSGYGRDGLPAHCYRSDNPRLVLVAPRPPVTCTGEHLKPMNRLSCSIIHYL
jgi:hypothetical protein